jgi:hypothetical protein
MEYNENTFYNFALFILVALALIQLYKMYSARKEHMDASLLNHQYVDWPGIHDRDHIPAPQHQEPVFYTEDDDAVRSPDQQLTSPIITDAGLACGPHFDWLVPQSLGAGNRYDDMLWAKTSPKNILKNGCTNCQKYSEGKVFNDSVSGLPSMNGDGLLEDNYNL